MLSKFFQLFIVLGMYNFEEWWLKFRHIWKHQKHLHGRQGISLFKFQAAESPKANWDRDMQVRLYLKMVLKACYRDISKTTTFWNSYCEPIIHYQYQTRIMKMVCVRYMTSITFLYSFTGHWIILLNFHQGSENWKWTI